VAFLTAHCIFGEIDNRTNNHLPVPLLVITVPVPGTVQFFPLNDPVYLSFHFREKSVKEPATVCYITSLLIADIGRPTVLIQSTLLRIGGEKCRGHSNFRNKRLLIQIQHSKTKSEFGSGTISGS
jgi:hypothetical protein